MDSNLTHSCHDIYNTFVPTVWEVQEYDHALKESKVWLWRQEIVWHLSKAISVLTKMGKKQKGKKSRRQRDHRLYMLQYEMDVTCFANVAASHISSEKWLD